MNTKRNLADNQVETNWVAKVIEIESSSSPEAEILRQAEAAGVDLHRLPRHVAIIMDGNGRWARAMKRPRIEGHRAGIKSVREIVRICRQLEIRYLTLYAFSAENWKRPSSEINALMILLCNFLKRELREMKENGIRLEAIGRLFELPDPVQRALDHARRETAAGGQMQLTLALSYGGRLEITDAVRKIATEIQAGRLLPAAIDPDLFAAYLHTAGTPDPDLLIRTSGEMRVSNFLLWQIAYSEIYITPTYWPDFRRKHLLEAVLEYQQRERRYGGI